MNAPLDDRQVARALGRLLGTGPLTRLPSRRGDLEMLLALAAALFENGRIHREDEINERLQHWLERFALPHALDHVSLRRALVDLRYLLRDASGSAYRCNPVKIAAQLTDSARAVDPGEILHLRKSERAERKRRRGR